MDKKIVIVDVEYRSGTNTENKDRIEWLVITLKRDETEHQFDLPIVTYLDEKYINIRAEVKTAIELAKKLDEDTWMTELLSSDIMTVVEDAIEYFYVEQRRRKFLEPFYCDYACVWLTASFGPPSDG